MKTQSFPKKKRILSSSDFKSILDDGKKLKSESFTVFAKKFSESRDGRLGISVSKKVGKANLRNRIKRILRETFRRTPEMNEKDWVFLVNPKARVKRNSELSQEIKKVIHKVANR